MTGSYRQKDVLELWDTRNCKKVRDINWDGPVAAKVSDLNMEEDKEEAKEGDEENQDP